jgi:mono/diheme cytochrome c family protein
MKTKSLLLLPLLFVGATLVASVDDNWSKHCSACHGADGKGNTKMGKKLSIKDLTNPEFQASFTDEDAAKAIREGIKTPDGKTKMKPISGLSDEEVAELVALVRRLKA